MQLREALRCTRVGGWHWGGVTLWGAGGGHALGVSHAHSHAHVGERDADEEMLVPRQLRTARDEMERMQALCAERVRLLEMRYSRSCKANSKVSRKGEVAV
jgi:hypothetical protein